MLATQFVKSCEYMLFFLPLKLIVVCHHTLCSCRVSFTVCGGHRNAPLGCQLQGWSLTSKSALEPFHLCRGHTSQEGAQPIAGRQGC